MSMSFSVPVHFSPLVDVLTSIDECSVAVSGGVDSMTLAILLHRINGPKTIVFHAVSPAVPVSATERVKQYAEQGKWDLRIIDVGEFGDGNYISNPVNRCFYCKNRLYAGIRGETDVPIFSGANVDDLGDYRPGLWAAQIRSVRHPYVEAGLTKNDVRNLADALNCRKLAELPSSPCLSSRVETGISIDPHGLKAIDVVEARIRDTLKPQVVRCRIRRSGINIELDSETLARLSPQDRRRIAENVSDVFAGQSSFGSVSFSNYKRGSAFLRVESS
jgi:uncharacterized protein